MSGNQIDLWLADLQTDGRFEKQAFALLSADERSRAQRLRFPLHRSRYVVRRGVLRMLLGSYLKKSPEALTFDYGEYGKPLLRDAPLHFNLSHSSGHACFAISSSSPVGVDMERVRIFPDLTRVAENFCSPAEELELASLSAEEQPALFFKYWTQREAIGKAAGKGLSDQIYGTGVPSNRLLQAPRCEATQWHLRTWEVMEGYVCSLASQHPEPGIVQHRFAGV